MSLFMAESNRNLGLVKLGPGVKVLLLISKGAADDAVHSIQANYFLLASCLAEHGAGTGLATIFNFFP
ncbi:MAG: hypothetical protein NTY70_06720, partial [Burkholderiales bacterium]|nr:hypothetical protein [Burkholderiales bacterium]